MPAVRVSMIGFGDGFTERRLEGREAPVINADLTGGAVDLTKAARLVENANVAFMGDTKGGAFDVSGELAREWLEYPLNPNGRPNSDVLKPWRNARDMTRRAADKWIIDFGWTMSEGEVALFEAPFRHVLTLVMPERASEHPGNLPRELVAACRTSTAVTSVLSAAPAFLVTPRVAKHRTFSWLVQGTNSRQPPIRLCSLGRPLRRVVQSKHHELWSLATCSWLGVGNDPTYNNESCFETFPFPKA